MVWENFLDKGKYLWKIHSFQYVDPKSAQMFQMKMNLADVEKTENFILTPF